MRFGFLLVPLVALWPVFVMAEEPDIIIHYGSAVDLEKIERDVVRIERRGVTVELQGGYEIDECVAILNIVGEELFRFGSASIDGATMAVAALRVAQGEQPSDLTQSDCPF